MCNIFNAVVNYNNIREYIVYLFQINLYIKVADILLNYWKLCITNEMEYLRSEIKFFY